LVPRLLLLGALLAPGLVGAADPRPLFDSHLHYNGTEDSGLTPRAALATLAANQVTAAVVTGRPPEAALELYRRAPGRVVPILGVYRNAGDKEDWYRDAALPGRVAAALEEGPWRGIGELHLFAPHRRSPVFLRLVDLAVERGLPLQMHADPAVIDALFEHAPGATVVWAHAGAYPCPDLLRDYLDRYPRLYADLSMRDGRVAPEGVLDSGWALLLMEYPDRFMVGVDTYSPGRWERLGEVTATIRAWLGQLPTEVAEALARDNAARVFGTGAP
jgi:predicted TIM-barrel fold metal-dependent hydrolase